MLTLPSLLLIGCGHMGNALLKGWLTHNLSPSIIVHRHPLKLPNPHQHVHSIEEIPLSFQPDIVILATKPDQIEELIPSLEPWCKSSIILSVLGGRSLRWLEQRFPSETPIVRSLPNTPSEVGLGMTIAVKNKKIQSKQQEQVHSLFEAVGKIAWLESEEKIDIATAISGCGPAYIFLLAELLQKIGQEKGLSEELAKNLARQTIIGSAALLKNSTQESEALRKAVATPNGITEKAINILNAENEWPDSLTRALEAAANRSKELAF